MDGWVGGWVGQWVGGLVVVVDGWVGGWIEGWMGGWVSGWVGGWMDGWIDISGGPLFGNVKAEVEVDDPIRFEAGDWVGWCVCVSVSVSMYIYIYTFSNPMSHLERENTCELAVCFLAVSLFP